MGLRGSVQLINFELDLKLSKKRQALRAAGNKLATRIRKRLKASGKFQQSGQLVRSIKFRLKRNEASGTVAPFGIRDDADTHTRRAPMSNLSIAAFQAAKGHDLIQMTADDEAFAVKEVEEQIAKILGAK